jgi:hypothetical protein
MRAGQIILLTTTAVLAVTSAYADDTKISEKGPFAQFELAGPYQILESVHVYGHFHVVQTRYSARDYCDWTGSRPFRNIPRGYQIWGSTLFRNIWRFPEASDVEDLLQGKMNRLNGFDYAPEWNWNSGVEPEVNF